MNKSVVIVCWIFVVITAVILRFEDLGGRPFHADEATGARITARRMESGGSQFDPKHYHGPLLADLAIPLCVMRGETEWRSMSKTGLRLLPAIAGSLVVLLPLWWRRRFGDLPMLAAALFLATSPLLVYYSRMFIHEMLLVLFGIAALMSLVGKPRWGIPGIWIGLMFATKETFAISLLAWTGAGAWVAWEHRKLMTRSMMVAAWRDYRVPVIVSGVVAAVVAFGIYTDGFRNPKVAVDAVRTFFVYETVTGHDKPLAYYFQLLLVPFKSGGFWWFGTPVVLLALAAYASTFRRDVVPAGTRAMIRFLAYSAIGHFLIYSLIAYKTPWLACLPWAHVCLLAGFAVNWCFSGNATGRAVMVALTVLCAAGQWVQARHATGRLASDERNPYAYVPTRKDVEAVQTWLEKLRASSRSGEPDRVAVIGQDYWPLPWYLRSFDKTGYWKQAPADLGDFPLVIAMPDAEGQVAEVLGDGHVQLPRGLRAGVPIHLFVRKDVWDQWLAADKP